jgi:hypothetical protein
MYVITK